MDLEKIQAYRDKQKTAEKERLQRKREGIQTSVITAAISDAAKRQIKHRELTTTKVNVQNNLATPEDIAKVVTALQDLSVALKPESIELQPLIEKLEALGSKLDSLPSKLPKVPKPNDTVKVSNIGELKSEFKQITDAVKALEFNPVFDPKIEVKPADVTVSATEVDLKPLLKAVEALQKEFKALNSKEYQTDLEPLIEASRATTAAIQGLRFPVPNYVIPFKDSSGKGTQVQLQSDASVPVTIIGGSSSSGKATDAYGIQAISDDGTYKYFFFEDDSANYYVMRKHKTNNTFSYTKGTGGYASVYVSSTAGPSGTPTWADRGATF